MNSIISWVGGKKALRAMIYQRMPKEFGRYIEVFGGGGWVLFGRPPDAAMEVYNDFNQSAKASELRSGLYSSLFPASPIMSTA